MDTATATAELTTEEVTVEGGQLTFDFSASNAERARRARKRAEVAADKTPGLFAEPPNLDIHLYSNSEAIADASGPEPERAFRWLESHVGPLRQMRPRRAAFNVRALDRLLWVRPPISVTLDGASSSVAKALWATELGYRPLKVERIGRRIVASSVRWPTGLRIVDAPWTAVAALMQLGLNLEVDERAERLMLDKLGKSKSSIAKAGLAGTSVIIEANSRTLLEALELPGLAYDGGPHTGRYRMPLLAADVLLEMPQVSLSSELRNAITRSTRRIHRLQTDETFPWTLYTFQSKDAGKARRILQTTGGVLLAGEMGSGKTTIALSILHVDELWPALIIAPLSAFSTWARQLEEMNKTFVLANESLQKSWAKVEEFNYDALVMSYDRLHAFGELVEKLEFKSLIADEIQRIRTPGSRRSRALRSLAASVPHRIGLSGTPLTNTVNDLLPIGAFLAPGEWKPRANSKDLSDLYPKDPVQAITEHLGVLMVRRRMEDTGAKLPNRRDHRIYVQLTPEQRRALRDLEEEAQKAKEDGMYNDPSSRFHAFAKLQRMRSIINNPALAGVGGINPKIKAAMDLCEDFLEMNRKGVIFCADRATFRDLGEALDQRGIGWVGIWGSTPSDMRITNEKRFHTEDDVKVVLCTIQAGSESWSASPTATWLISTSYMYAPSILSQMEARVYRMNSDVDGPAIDICYTHAQAPGGTLDDRMLEILEVKKHLFAYVVDRTAYEDKTQTHYSMSDLVYLLTGEKDDKLLQTEADEQATLAREKEKKDHARRSIYKNKRHGLDAKDDGSMSSTFEEMYGSDQALFELDKEESFENLADENGDDVDFWKD